MVLTVVYHYFHKIQLKICYDVTDMISMDEPQKPITTVKALLRLTCTRVLPTEYILPWFVPEPTIMYEVRYKTFYNNSDRRDRVTKPVALIKLQSLISNGKFSYKEIIKYDLVTGHKIRRVSGNLIHFLGHGFYRSEWPLSYSRFSIRFPYWLIKDTPKALTAIEAFGESIVKLTMEDE